MHIFPHTQYVPVWDVEMDTVTGVCHYDYIVYIPPYVKTPVCQMSGNRIVLYIVPILTSFECRELTLRF